MLKSWKRQLVHALHRNSMPKSEMVRAPGRKEDDGRSHSRNISVLKCGAKLSLPMTTLINVVPA
jgi:hypothetical protein